MGISRELKELVADIYSHLKDLSDEESLLELNDNYCIAMNEVMDLMDYLHVNKKSVRENN